jgi:hypothetical protein
MHVTRTLTAVVLSVLIAAAGGGLAGCAGGAREAGSRQGGSDLLPGLGALPLLRDARTRSISAENPTGKKGEGGMASPDPKERKPAASARAADDLGRGWKVKPFIRVNAGETATLMDVDGPGIIEHIWIVEGLNRGLVIRFYWDGEAAPSIESPVPDLFAVGHGKFAPVNSLPVMVNPSNALNCYWPMPFRRHARITLTNETAADVELVAYQITYVETAVPREAGALHAQWRRAPTADRNPYVILDGVKGKGRYVGTFLAWTQMTKGWFGEGEIKFFLDGDGEFPTICGTGTEDYFLGSYGFPRPFSTAYSGTVLPSSDSSDPPTQWSLYRWHIQDPIEFDRDLRVTIQALGWGPDGKYMLLDDDISSTALWYQAEPHAPFPPLPDLAARLAAPKSPAAPLPGAVECEGLKVEASPGAFAASQDLRAFAGAWSGGAHLFVQAKGPGEWVELRIPAEGSKPMRIALRTTRAKDYGILRFSVNGIRAGKEFDGYSPRPVPAGPIDLGVFEPRDGEFRLRVQVVGSNPAAVGSKHFFGLDCAVLTKP